MSSRNRPTKRPKLDGDGSFGRLGYFFSRAVANLRQNILVSALTVGTISLSLLIIALFLLVYVNLEKVAETWSEKVQLTAFFEKELTAEELSAFKDRIASLGGTEKIVYVSKNEAMKRFRDRLKGQETFLEGVVPDVLPAAIEISLNKASRNSEAVDSYASRLKNIPGITEVQYGEEWVRRFNTFLNFMRLIGALVGGFLVLAGLFIVSNTIKLTIYARKDELEVLGLVGATRFFIKAPFLIEGIIQGAAGGLVALVTLAACYFGFLHNAGNFLSFNVTTAGLSFLPLSHLIAIFAGGVFVGFIGSLTSLKRFIAI
ncbi:cell division ABC transporter, membrane protein FtsX, putative [Geotalea daltonii FRC-32]|uniref:Cell division protein FtsX n=1 Tax=Geotalea daltonii (strain DSM 22248 / JCM 15807 / FRC-32) TaxID=316067 RepID=B9M0Z9_GEODF|nr:permease-like cell division protein FtsX [Geotalea daltonii]ACM21002.1 cell division ABC transporter, membrane protein FtsX, putative [Geotalea daltonii FRC-32]